MAGLISDKEIACELTKSAIESGLIRRGTHPDKTNTDVLIEEIVSFYQSILKQLSHPAK